MSEKKRKKKTLSRRKVPLDVEMAVLAKSARRCTLCFGLRGDLGEKLGQMAHIDGNRANYAEDNLAWMCLNHHSLFDSRTSQHKNYTLAEVKEYRNKLYRIVAQGQHLLTQKHHPRTGERADRRTLKMLLELMSKSGSIDFLRGRNFAGWSFDWKRLDGIERFIMRESPEYEFIDPELEKLRKTFHVACKMLITLLATHTFPVARGEGQSIPEDWELEQPERFHKAVTEVHGAADAVCSSYDRLVRTARRKLLP
jgi:hypothetical protein